MFELRAPLMPSPAPHRRIFRLRAGSIAAAIAALVALSPTSAAAEEPPSPKRALPSYDGRPEAATTPGDVLIWVPRVALFPVYAVTEYVIRTPLGLLTVAAERGKWIDTITNAFKFGPEKNIGVVPTALLDFGFRVSGGIYFFYDDFLFKKNEFRIHAAYGGPGWMRLTVADRIPITKSSHLKLRFEAAQRPDFVFYGIGPGSRLEDRSRYGAEWIDGSAAYHSALPFGLTADAYVGTKTLRFRTTQCCDDVGLKLLVARGAYPVPATFETGYTGFRSGVHLAYDTRKPRPEPGSGIRIEGGFEYGADLRQTGAGWVKYGGTAGGFADITGRNRIVSLSATFLFADPLQKQDMPFTELVTVGGLGTMSGFRPGRLLGRSAAILGLEYRYPIWAFLDGSAQLAVGNVFDQHLRGFEPENLRLSFAFGLRTVGERDHSFNVLVGAGTETFANHARLNEARFVFGATQGF